MTTAGYKETSTTDDETAWHHRHDQSIPRHRSHAHKTIPLLLQLLHHLIGGVVDRRVAAPGVLYAVLEPSRKELGRKDKGREMVRAMSRIVHHP